MCNIYIFLLFRGCKWVSGSFFFNWIDFMLQTKRIIRHETCSQVVGIVTKHIAQFGNFGLVLFRLFRIAHTVASTKCN